MPCAFASGTDASCTNRAVLITGDCRYCKNHYCNTHRLPESHTCPNMVDVRSRAIERNTAAVMAGKTVEVKMNPM